MKTIFEKFNNSWSTGFGILMLQELLTSISMKIAEDRTSGKVVYPEAYSDLLFKAFELTPLNSVKVVIIGQDPYHDGSFNGVAFGNGTPGNKPNKISPSLRNIVKEVKRSFALTHQEDRFDYSLYSWAQQGVLLINTAHTVVAKTPNSHIEIWKDFTDKVISVLSLKKNIVWLLWGNNAHSFDNRIVNNTHHIIKSGHPSPLNTFNPFVGCNCFVECNDILLNKYQENLILWDTAMKIKVKKETIQTNSSQS